MSYYHHFYLLLSCLFFFFSLSTVHLITEKGKDNIMVVWSKRLEGVVVKGVELSFAFGEAELAV